jgi:hypothetical protein
LSHYNSGRKLYQSVNPDINNNLFFHIGKHTSTFVMGMEYCKRKRKMDAIFNLKRSGGSPRTTFVNYFSLPVHCTRYSRRICTVGPIRSYRWAEREVQKIQIFLALRLLISPYGARFVTVLLIRKVNNYYEVCTQ